MDSQTLYCYLKQIKEDKKKVIAMALTKKGMGITASQIANERYQREKMQEFIEDAEPFDPRKPKEEKKEKPGYNKKKINSKVTWNY